MTENGWPPNTDAYPGVPLPRNQCVDVKIPGTTLVLPFQKGIPAIILPAFMADLNQFIEPVYNSRGYADEGSWTAVNDVSTSNHLGGTAFDYNWFDPPFLIEDAGWNGSELIDGNQVPAVEELLAWYEGMVFWGNNWNSPKDAMHFQMGYGTYQDQNKCRDFINRKIRADGFSKYKRSDVAGPAKDDTKPPVTQTPKPETNLMTGDLWASQSIYRDNNDKWMSERQTLASIDAMKHMELVEQSALRGEQWAIGDVVRLSRGQGPGAKTWFAPYDTDNWAVEHAKAVLKEIIEKNPGPVQTWIDNEKKAK